MYVNAPRYLLRKRLVLDLLRPVQPGKVLEIGCGAGDLCATLYQMGYDVRGIDSSERAIQLCQELHKDIYEEEGIQFELASIYDINDLFDVVLMFEVLEHIKDDRAALSRVHDLLRPEGQLLLSVPAHQSLFGPSDVFAGHYRRYDRAELVRLLEESRFRIQKMWSYGFPLANITEGIRNFLYKKKAVQPKEAASAQIGIDRPIEARLRWFCNDLFLYPFYWMQSMFLQSDLGTGYILKAEKMR